MEDTKSNEDRHRIEDRRLWIGNLDSRVTEYQLLKLVQKHGSIEKFDMLFHRTGLLVGQPRGYAFVTYMKKEEAEKARTALNGQTIGQKSIVVTWAHSINNDEVEQPKPDVKIPALAMAKEEKKVDRMTQIQAIEAKLKLMEKKKEEELRINDTVASKAPVIVQFQYNKNKPVVKSRTLCRKSDKYTPYSRNKNNR